MNLEKGNVYLAQSGSYLRFESKGLLMYNFLLVDNQNVPIAEKRNRFGHVILRSKRCYSEETVSSFKLTNIKQKK